MVNKEELVINRLVLVGNGFDLALGLKTSYTDFIFWLKKRLITEAFQNSSHYYSHNLNGFLENDLYSIEISDFFKSTWDDFLIFLQRQDYSEQLRGFKMFMDERKKSIILSSRSNFIGSIDTDLENLGWVNIENIFYQYLTRVKDESLKNLNQQLSTLKNYLKEYLQEVQATIPNDTQGGHKYFSSFRSLVCNTVLNPNEFNPEQDINQKDLKLGKLQFVNFNYTSTVSKLVKQFDARQELMTNPIIQIHGGLDDSMIFGYGDEEDEDYPRLEKTGDNNYLEHVKSFRYLQNSDYYDLIRFTNSGPYQILVLGHSCGLSDRTMLKELFENENCLSIKPLYYQWTEVYEEDGEQKEISRNDYFDKVMEISRHFSVNGMMRKKVVSFDKCEPMPQIKNIQ